MSAPNLYKLAAVALSSLKEENEQLRAHISKLENAERTAFDLYKSGQLAIENLESTIKDLATKSPDEIEVIKRASEFSKTASALTSVFKVGNKLGDDGSLDNLTKFLIEDY